MGFLKKYQRESAPGGFVDLPPGYPSANIKQLTVRSGYARYDFAVDGGSHTAGSGIITPKTTWSIPSGAVVVLGSVNSTTAPVGTGATVAIGTSAGSAGNSILTATAITSMTLDAVLAATANTTPFKMSAAGNITFTIATADLTAGVIELFVVYWTPVNA